MSSKRFFKIIENHQLQPNRELRITEYFVDKHWKNISNPVTLILPNGAQQKIFWVKRNGDVYLEKNWEKFAKFLKFGYILYFKYIGRSSFKVKIFGRNTLEIDYSNVKFIDEEENVEVRKRGRKKVNFYYESEQEDAKDVIFEVSEDENVEVRKRGKKKMNFEDENVEVRNNGKKKVNFDYEDENVEIRKSGKKKMNFDFEDEDVKEVLEVSEDENDKVKKYGKKKVNFDFNAKKEKISSKFKAKVLEVSEDENDKVKKYGKKNVNFDFNAKKEKISIKFKAKVLEVSEDENDEVRKCGKRKVNFEFIAKKQKNSSKFEAKEVFDLSEDETERYGFSTFQKKKSDKRKNNFDFIAKKQKNSSKFEAREVIDLSEDETEEKYGVGAFHKRKSNKRKMNIDFDKKNNLAGGNNGGINKKAKVCIKTEDHCERARNDDTHETNPSFFVQMSKSYINGNYLRIPRAFTRKHMEEFQGTARIQVGMDMALKVRVIYEDVNFNGTCIITVGWKSFAKKYRLKIGDICKFVMIQSKHPLFDVFIIRAAEASSYLKDLEPHEKQNTFNICVNSSYPYIQNEFFKEHKERDGKFMELKYGGKSWLVKVKYYERGVRFYAGWLQFREDCKLRIGDICHFELIDEEKFVFKIFIERRDKN